MLSRTYKIFWKSGYLSHPLPPSRISSRSSLPVFSVLQVRFFFRSMPPFGASEWSNFVTPISIARFYRNYYFTKKQNKIILYSAFIARRRDVYYSGNNFEDRLPRIDFQSVSSIARLNRRFPRNLKVQRGILLIEILRAFITNFI